MNDIATNVRSRWTPEDQARLDELTLRRQRIMDTNRTPVVAVMAAVCESLVAKGFEPIDVNQLAGALADETIVRADALRDALQPFDSGVRTS